MSARLLESSLREYRPYRKDVEIAEEEMIRYDAFSFRFAKFIEMGLRFLVSLELYLYGEKSDTLRNRLLRLERAGYISSGETWIRARTLRNEVVHAYLPSELENIYQSMFQISSDLLEDFKNLEKKLRDITM